LAKTKTKLLELLDKFSFYQKAFFKRVKEENFDDKVAEYWWNVISSQASYSFAKSHSYPYSKLTYLTMYLKSKYPKQFFVALLNNTARNKEDREGTSEISKIIFTARKDYGIKTEPPDINKSRSKFYLNKNGDIQFGFNAIKDVGKAGKLIAEKSPYGSFGDFMGQTETETAINKRVIMALIYAGCFNSLESDKASLIKEYETLKDKKGRNQNAFIDITKMKAGNKGKTVKYDKVYFLRKEIEFLNLTFENVDDSEVYPAISKLEFPNERITCSAFVEVIRERISKKGKPYIYMRITDFAQSVSLMAFKEKKEYLDDMKINKGMTVRVKATKAQGSTDLYFVDDITVQKNE